MELGPIFRALLHNRGRFVLIAVEIALTLAIVVNCLHLIRQERDKMARPTGIAEDEILAVTMRPWSERFEDPAYVEEITRRDIAAMHAIPGVQAATVTNAVPLSGGGSATGLNAEGNEGDDASVPFFVVTSEAMQTLGVELVAGRTFIESDFPPPGLTVEEVEKLGSNANVIVTQDMADRFFPDGDALGKKLDNRDGDEQHTIVGIIRRMHNSWPQSKAPDRTMLVPGMAADGRRIDYLVRATADSRAAVKEALEPALVAVDPDRVMAIETLTEIKADTYGFSRALIKILVGVAALLVLVTSIGIVGLTAFSVTERTRQIGTRRALGATRGAILRYFLIENGMVTGVGLTVGIGVAILLDRLLRSHTLAPPLDLSALAIGMLALWLTGLFAALAPALRATRVPPVVATRTV